jgi:hypothetical protein
MEAFEYGWGDSNDPADAFWVKFKPCLSAPKTWKEEIYSAARSITGTSTKPLWLCFSGGIDSEVMCRAFYDQGIHFSVLTLEHAARTNRHDISYAKKWCAQRGVSQRIVPIDMGEFLNSDVRAYAEQGYISAQIFRYIQIRLLETVEGFGGQAVLGGGEQLYDRDPDAPYGTRLPFEVGYAVPLEWSRRNKTHHHPYFYFSTPELVASYLQIPLVAFAIQHGELFAHPNNKKLLKRMAYQSVWNDLEPRPKYNGFENISPSRKDANDLLRRTFGTQLQTYQLPVPKLIEQLQIG